MLEFERIMGAKTRNMTVKTPSRVDQQPAHNFVYAIEHGMEKCGEVISASCSGNIKIWDVKGRLKCRQVLRDETQSGIEQYERKHAHTFTHGTILDHTSEPCIADIIACPSLW